MRSNIHLEEAQRTKPTTNPYNLVVENNLAMVLQGISNG